MVFFRVELKSNLDEDEIQEVGNYHIILVTRSGVNYDNNMHSDMMVNSIIDLKGMNFLVQIHFNSFFDAKPQLFFAGMQIHPNKIIVTKKDPDLSTPLKNIFNYYIPLVLVPVQMTNPSLKPRFCFLSFIPWCFLTFE